jgi:hypothetical protein
MKRKPHPSHTEQPTLLDPEPPISISVRMVGGLSELVRNEASASEMDVSSWIRKACWDQLRDVEYGAMEKRLLASFETLRSEMMQRQWQTWNAVSATFAVLLQMIDSDPDNTVSEESLEKALQYFSQFRTKPAAPPAGSSDPKPAKSTADEGKQPPERIISFG